MVIPAIKQQILNDLERLMPEQQRHAAELIRGFASTLPKGIAGRDLLRFAGTMDDESACQMTGAIEEGCERVDLDEW